MTKLLHAGLDCAVVEPATADVEIDTGAVAQPFDGPFPISAAVDVAEYQQEFAIASGEHAKIERIGSLWLQGQRLRVREMGGMAQKENPVLNASFSYRKDRRVRVFELVVEFDANHAGGQASFDFIQSGLPVSRLHKTVA